MLVARLHSTRAALIAALMVAVSFRSVMAPSTFMQEQLYLPALASAFALLAVAATGAGSIRVLFLSGIAFGVAALCRSMPVYFIGPSALALWLTAQDRRTGAWQASVLVTGFAVVAVPYSLWLSRQADQFIAIENIGAYVYVRGDAALRHAIVGSTPTTGEIAIYLGQRFLAAPWEFIREKIALVGLMFRTDGGRWLESTGTFATAASASWAKSMAHLLGDFVSQSAAILAPLGVLRAHHRRVAALLVVWIVVHLGMTVLATYSGPRFREPIQMPLFALAACVMAGTGRRNSRRTLVAGGVVAAAMAVTVASSVASSLEGRADYGVAPWTTTGGRRATTTVGEAGFNVRPLGGSLEFEATLFTGRTRVRPRRKSVSA